MSALDEKTMDFVAALFSEIVLLNQRLSLLAKKLKDANIISENDIDEMILFADFGLDDLRMRFVSDLFTREEFAPILKYIEKKSLRTKPKKSD